MVWASLVAAVLLAASAQPQSQMDRPMQGQGQASRLPPRSPPPTTAESPPERIPIDLGDDEWASDPPQTIDILAPPTQSEAANAAELKDCENQREAGVVAGEIVVCRELPADTSQLYSGSREAWLKDYAERTQNAGALPPPDVAGPGIFRGPATVSGLCFIPPCPKDPALIIDVEAIPPPPEGSDAERVAQGLKPVEGTMRRSPPKSAAGSRRRWGCRRRQGRSNSRGLQRQDRQHQRLTRQAVRAFEQRQRLRHAAFRPFVRHHRHHHLAPAL